MPTICGLRRRGYTPASIRNFSVRTVSYTHLEYRYLRYGADLLRGHTEERKARGSCPFDVQRYRRGRVTDGLLDCKDRICTGYSG